MLGRCFAAAVDEPTELGPAGGTAFTPGLTWSGLAEDAAESSQGEGECVSLQSLSSAPVAVAFGGVLGAPNVGGLNPGGILYGRESIAITARSGSVVDDPGLAETGGGLFGAGFATANENRGMRVGGPSSSG